MNLPAPTASRVQFASDYMPQDNFGTKGRTPEAEMAKAFSFAYFHKFSRLHSSSNLENLQLLREFPVAGLGIADLVAVSQSSSSLSIRAFELKIGDWRRGLSQAFRYKYYADASILVVPTQKLAHISNSLDMFKKLGVGLWGFDQDRLSIKQVLTPRPKKQFTPRYRSLALKKLDEKIISQPGP